MDNGSLKVSNLAFSRDGRMLCEGLDLVLRGGEWCAVTGANGAGKTTLLRILCGLSEADAGAFHWRGLSPALERGRYHEQVLYIGHKSGFRSELSVAANLAFYSGLGRARAADTVAQAISAADDFGIAGWLDTPCAKLSQGQLRRASLSRLLVERASLWLLDEPGVGLDDDGIGRLERLLAAHLERGGAALVATHGALAPPGRPAAHNLRLGEDV